MILLFIGIAFVVGIVESWMFMLGVGMLHIHILEAIHPISYGVSVQFVLLTMPVQVFGAIYSSMGE